MTFAVASGDVVPLRSRIPLNVLFCFLPSTSVVRTMEFITFGSGLDPYWALRKIHSGTVVV